MSYRRCLVPLSRPSSWFLFDHAAVSVFEPSHKLGVVLVWYEHRVLMPLHPSFSSVNC